MRRSAFRIEPNFACPSRDNARNAIVPSASASRRFKAKRMVFLRGAVSNLSIQFPLHHADPANGVSISAPRASNHRNPSETMRASALIRHERLNRKRFGDPTYEISARSISC